MAYKGDLTSAEAAEQMASQSDAVVIDVRTQPEWQFVGVPAIENAHFISWQVYPTMAVNGDFAAAVDELGLSKDQPIYMLCRSGARSAAAGNLLAEQGYSNVFNVSDGFEGDKDAAGHRCKTGGWKAAGLPWSQG